MGEDLPNSQSSQTSTFSDLLRPIEDLDVEITPSMTMDILNTFDDNSQRVTNGYNISSTGNSQHYNSASVTSRRTSAPITRTDIASYNHHNNRAYENVSTNGTMQNDNNAPFVQQSNSCAYQSSTHGSHQVTDGMHNGISYSHSTNMVPSNSTQYSSSPGSICGSTHASSHHSHSPYTPTNVDHPTTPPLQVTNSNLPCLTDYPGEYGFELYFGEKTESAQKSAQYTHSHLLNKLYVKMNSLHPVMFKTAMPPPPNTVLRAMPVYMLPDNTADNVTRCPNHQLKDQYASDQMKSHLIRIDQHPQGSSVHYHRNEYGRESVCIPYPTPEVGSHYGQVLFKYMCLSSCVGGINRRPISTVFTIESGGVVIGRKSVEVRICSCPGRDRSQDEKRKRKPANVLIPLPKKKKSEASTSRNTTDNQEDDNEIYFLPVKGIKNYELLKSIKEGLEIKNAIDPAALQSYRAQRQKEEDNALRSIMVRKFFKEQNEHHQDEKTPFPTKSSQYH